MIESLTFYSLAALTLGSALAVVLLRNVMHSALFLGLALAGVAGLFAALGADFLFASQILVYVSGIALLVVFVVMLAGRASDLRLRQTNRQWVGALVVCGLALAALRPTLAAFAGRGTGEGLAPKTADLAELMLGRLAVPFELISLILIAAMIGAVLFTRTEAE